MAVLSLLVALSLSNLEAVDAVSPERAVLVSAAAAEVISTPEAVDAGPAPVSPAGPTEGPQFLPEKPTFAAPTPPVAALAPDAGPAPLTAAGVLDVVFAWVRPYAIFKPTLIASGTAVESFSQPNASAITAAANPVMANLPDQGRLTFQVAQTRAGLWFNEKGQVRARVEIDFIDFTKASPTTASLPRLRVGYIEWAPTESFTLLAGQDWDLHSPVGAHGGNMVGNRFLSGNAGFMRQQVKAIGKVGVFELAAAVGMEGVNTTAKDNAFELSMVPTFALRGAWLVGKGRVGVSGLGTSLRLNPGAATERRAFAGGVTAFADVTLGSTNLRGAPLRRRELRLGERSRPAMVMHPMSPALNGTDLSTKADPRGKRLFIEMVNGVKASPAGEAYVGYMWPKPGASEPVPKVSFVKLRPRWGWVIGAGVYTDDLHRTVNVLISSSVALSLMALLLTLVMSILLARRIAGPLRAAVASLSTDASSSSSAVQQSSAAVGEVSQRTQQNADEAKGLQSLVVETTGKVDAANARLAGEHLGARVS